MTIAAACDAIPSTRTGDARRLPGMGQASDQFAGSSLNDTSHDGGGPSAWSFLGTLEALSPAGPVVALMDGQGVSLDHPHYSIVVMDEFISVPEGDEIPEERDCTLLAAEPDHRRWTNARLFTDEFLALVTTVEARLGTSFGVAPTDLEWWRPTRFNYHLDASCGDDHRPAIECVSSCPSLPGRPPPEGRMSLYSMRRGAQAGRLLGWENLFADGTPDHPVRRRQDSRSDAAQRGRGERGSRGVG